MRQRRIDRFLVSRRVEPRRGAAFLMLVVMVALIVLAATTSLIQNEIQSRRGTTRWIRSQVMAAAMDKAKRFEITSQTPWSLPLGDDGDEFLEVSKNDATSEIIVRWIRRGDVIDQMIRTVETAPTDSERTQ